MNETINIFKFYRTEDLLKSLFMFILVGAFPAFTVIQMFIQIILLSLPQHMMLLTFMAIILVAIFTFSSHIFIATLKQYNQIDELNYKKLFYVLALPIAIITITLVYSIGLTLI